MRTKEFLSQLEHQRISEAIAAAERKTSGEIRVFIQRGELKEDALAVAQRKFHKLGMSKTAERNGVLVFVAPRPQKFAVVGDEGIHQKCGHEFWQRLVSGMAEHFRKENFTEALVHGIAGVGDLLAEHFPREKGDRNELPDTIIES